MTKAGFGLTIDTGEISAALSGVYGSGQAWTDNKTLKSVAKTYLDKSRDKFTAVIDSQATHLAHVYEYRVGGSGQEDIIHGEAGRLWRLQPVPDGDGYTVHVEFRDSRNPSNPSELLIGKHPMMSSHIFRDKADHLESRQRLSAKAGRTKYTERTRERPPGPPSPLIWEENGDIKYGMYRSWRNEFYGRFEQAFEQFWLGRIEGTSQQSFEQYVASLETPIAAATARPIVQARPASIPKIATPGVIKILDAGRYSGGRTRLNARYIREASNAVRKQMLRRAKWLD